MKCIGELQSDDRPLVISHFTSDGAAASGAFNLGHGNSTLELWYYVGEPFINESRVAHHLLWLVWLGFQVLHYDPMHICSSESLCDQMKCIFCIWTSDECLSYNRQETSSWSRHIKESKIHLFLILYQKYHCKPTIICDDFISRFTLNVAGTNICNQAFPRLLLFYNFKYMANNGP